MTQSGQSEIVSVFWQQWLKHEGMLYRCCLKLMNWNPTEAEDALSTVSLKAWKKVQQFGAEIANFQAWLMKLTRNVCIDIIRKRSRGPVGVENIEWMSDRSAMSTASAVASPQMVLEMEEKYVAIRRAVASLPQKMRDTFVLHYYEGLKHFEIAEQQGISYDSVCKRISLARKQLETKLRGYFRDEEDLATALEPAGKKSSTPVAQVEKPKIQSDDSIGKETLTVSAARECASVAEKEKASFVWCAVAQLALVGEKIKEICAKVSVRSPSPTPLAIVEKPTIHSSEETHALSTTREWVPVAVRLRSSQAVLVHPEKAEQHLWRANALVDTVCGSTPITPSFVAEFDTG
ncbi:MAG: sigma-70 family RNA polymerase sigma factor [Hormoscilla sp. GUM202]|nr:sigma-70 family RNA polymerase sigma factor [Hormoscilla sp. GUM202]